MTDKLIVAQDDKGDWHYATKSMQMEGLVLTSLDMVEITTEEYVRLQRCRTKDEVNAILSNLK